VLLCFPKEVTKLEELRANADTLGTTKLKFGSSSLVSRNNHPPHLAASGNLPGMRGKNK